MKEGGTLIERHAGERRRMRERESEWKAEEERGTGYFEPLCVKGDAAGRKTTEGETIINLSALEQHSEEIL